MIVLTSLRELTAVVGTKRAKWLQDTYVYTTQLLQTC